MNIYLLFTRNSRLEADGTVNYLSEMVDAFPTYESALLRLNINVEGQKTLEGLTFGGAMGYRSPQWIPGWSFFNERDNLLYLSDATTYMKEGPVENQRTITHHTERWIVRVEMNES